MTVGHQIHYYNNLGSKIFTFDTFQSLHYSRRVGKAGWLELVFSDSVLDFNTVRERDSRIEIMRRVGERPRYTEMNTHWLLRNFDWQTSAHLITVAGPSAFDLLRRRFVDNYASSSEADKTDFLDDTMKEIVDEQMLGGASAVRDISAFLANQSDAGAGPSDDKAFAWRNVLAVLEELIELSSSGGTIIFPDIVVLSDNTFEFRTFAGQRGADRSTSTLQHVFAEEFDNLEDVTLSYRYVDEVTHVKALGPGQKADRRTATATDSDRATASPFNRIEKTVQASRENISDAALQSEADSALEAGKPIITITGTVKQTPVSQYGVDYVLGDKVVARAKGIDFDAWIDFVDVTVDQNGEHLKIDILGVF